MVRKHSISYLLLPILLAVSLNAHTENNLSQRVNYAELPSDGYMQSAESCVIKSYWLSIEGKSKKSNNFLNQCKECKSNNLINKYYCNLIKINNYFWLQNFEALSRSYFSMANDPGISSLPRDTINHILNLGKMYSLIVKYKSKKHNKLIVSYVNGYPTFNYNYQDYIVDTGAVFSSLTNDSCKDSTSEKLLVTSYSGENSYERICMLDLENYGVFPATISNKNILGQVFINQFNKVIFSSELTSIRKKLYKDNPLIFFEGSLKLQGKSLDTIKYCLDSGSLTTTIMPSVYRKIKETIKHKNIKEFSIETPMGNTKTLGKLSDNLTFVLHENLSIQVKEIPALFRNNAFNQCDIVLGNDLIYQNVIALDLLNSQIHLTSGSYK